ncbi:MAG: Stk1 family PASTA domain-containing Ser/Thr kinase [Lachnospiraceae bacterium]|nr:Stk1 family PASTA domain-containing Ser/Thr kinase [Lachnospiraceae bacterium]
MINPGMLLSDRYEIIDRVGAGGMADVYKARDRRLNRYVAIKILKQEYSNDAKFVSKFRGEAQSVAGLSHLNIVNVYDVGEDDDLYYIVMELVEGITLKKFIEKKGRLDVNEAIGIGVQIAQGMQAAHDNHIIHRDIKPQNIIISKEGKVKVTDFGIAKAATSNTITSNAMGSVHYISPEQARGGYSDEKSDIYSLGVTMFEMLAGRVPFEGDSTVTVALAHIQEEAEILDQLEPDIPHSLSKIVMKCMQKKPDMRYMTAAALIADLKRALKEPDGDYVMITDVVDDSPTIVMDKDDVEQVKKSALHAEQDMPVESLNVGELADDEDAIDPKLERILKICSVVVAVIIVLVVFLIIGRVAGWWGPSGKSKKPQTTADSSASPSESSAALEKIKVPDLIGHTLEEAESMLDEAGLKYQLKPVESEEDANKVTDQEPKAGEEVEEGTRVIIYYSQESSGIVIPDVTNKSVEDARSELESQGLSVKGTTEQYSDTVPKGKVCGTDPVVGSSVKPGTSVTLVISKGPESDMVKVPNLVNKKYEIALEKLADAGLEAPKNPNYVYSDTVAEGRVVSQSVQSGTRVELGTVIDFTVSLGPKNAATQKPVATPTKEPTYQYVGTMKITANPFDYEGETATIKFVLEQDGKTKTVWSGTLSYSDFPFTREINGWSENNGKITVYKDGQQVGGTYNVEFKKDSM